MSPPPEGGSADPGERRRGPDAWPRWLWVILIAVATPIGLGVAAFVSGGTVFFWPLIGLDVVGVPALAALPMTGARRPDETPQDHRRRFRKNVWIGYLVVASLALLAGTCTAILFVSVGGG